MSIVTEALTRHMGRPRDLSRETALLEATIEVLQEVGYDRLTIDAVAARAHASKATVYRRWSGKAQLVVEAIKSMDEEADCAFPDTGSLRGDLRAGVAAIVERLVSDEGQLFAGVIGASMRDPELAAILHESMVEKKEASCRTVVDRAISRGEIDPSCTGDVLLHVLPPVLFFRCLTSPEPVDDAFLDYAVDSIALPLITRSFPSN